MVWLVVGDGYLPVEPIRRFLVYLEDVERSPNTLRAYAHHLKLFWEYLAWAKLDWTNVGLGDLAGFLERVMNLRHLAHLENRRRRTNLRPISG